MLRASLVKNLDSLELEQKDYDAIKSLETHRGMLAVLKHCLANVLRVEGEIFGEGSKRMSEGDLKGLIRERVAYYALADFIANPPAEEPENE